MDQQELTQQLERVRVIPVIVIEDVNSALPLADALIAGGLPVAEITFRTDAAPEAIALLKRKRPALLLGAGTILTEEQLSKARDCGASFAVSPGLNVNIVRKSMKLDMPFFPGVMTPTDVGTAVEMGISILKFFPAEAAGGVKLLKSLAAPYAHLGIRFIPTGGINQNNWESYAEEGHVLAVGGTWIAPQVDIQSEDWESIKNRCRALTD